MATGVPKTKWESKLNSHAIDAKPTETQILWQPYEEKGLPPNRLYFGDNLPILATLLEDSSVSGKVTLAYIDPPFATRSVFKSRAQKDAYHDLLEGENYVKFMEERLILLREILSKEGSIYVHLDENMAFEIKIVMDQIFGKSNFRNWIIRKKCNPKNYTRKKYGNIADYILFYTKSNKYVWNRPYQPWTSERAKQEYQYVEKETGRRYKKVPIHAPGTRNGKTGKPWKGMLPPPGKHWQFPPLILDEMDARGEIYWSPSGNPRRKIYLDESNGVPIQDIWLDFKDAHNQNIKITGYPTEKNPDMLAQIIQTSSNPGDLVLDCFSGSGTTLAVADKLVRRWIGVDNSVEAISTTLRRFTKGTEPMGDFVSKKKATIKHGRLFYQGPLQAQKEEVEIIKDFCLYVTESYQGELQNLLEEWKKEMESKS